MKTIAVISGGGSYGAYHAGTLAALNLKFDAVYGTSTGAMMAPLVALGKYVSLETAYTSLGQYNVFNSWATNPVKPNGKISIAKAITRIASGKNSLGATDKALKKTIREFYTKDMHDELFNKKDVIVNTVDLRKQQASKVEYFNAKDTPYELFTEYMRASASFPGIMSPVYLQEKELVDGGLAETASVLKAMENKPKVLHLFLHHKRVDSDAPKKEKAKNFLHMLMRILNTFMDEVKQNDLDQKMIKNAAKMNGVEEIHFHYMKEEFTNRLVFDKAEMRDMLQKGYANAHDPSCNFKLTKQDF